MNFSNIDVDKQITRIFHTAKPSISFHEYMQQHSLHWSSIAREAGVPAATVWRIDHGLAVSVDHANMVRSAVATITGVPFPGTIPMMR